jgi:hypothetical protein
MRLSGGVQAIECFSRDLDGGCEAERYVRATQVVVDRLRNADDAGQTSFHQLSRDAHRAIAAQRHECVDPELRKPRHDFARDVGRDFLAIGTGDRETKRVAAIRRSEDRSTEVQDPSNRHSIEVDQRIGCADE